LASLPSKETLQAQVVGRLAGLIQGLVFNLNFPLQQFAFVVKAVEQSKKN
jgi:ribosomal protein L10